MDDRGSEARILVTGGRDFSDGGYVHSTLDRLLYQLDNRSGPFAQLATTPKSQTVQLILIQGGARGADRLARHWAQSHNDRVILITENANWLTDGKAAGPRRNARMLDLHHPDLVVAFPGGRGTADMIDKAHKAGVRVIFAAHQDNSPSQAEASRRAC